MEWQKILDGAAGGLPVATVLGYVARLLWKKLEQKDKELADLQACKNKLQEKRIQDLKSILGTGRPEDSSD